MARWDGHTEQQKLENKKRKYATYNEKRRAKAAIAKASRSVIVKPEPTVKPKRQSKYAGWVTFLRSLPVEIVTGNIPFNPNALAIVPEPAPALSILPEQTLAWWLVRKNPSVWRDILKAKDWYGCATGSLAKSLPLPTDISKELLREQLEKWALLEAAECEAEYLWSQTRIEMDVQPTGELILWGEMLATTQKELAQDAALIRYFQAREKSRLREKGIRKERNAFFQPAPARKMLASSDPMLQTKEFLRYLKWLLTQERTPIFDGHKQLQAPKKIDVETIKKEIESVKNVTLKP